MGNDVLLKCNIPSFVSDFVAVTSWVDSEGMEFHMNSKYGNLEIVSQSQGSTSIFDRIDLLS